MLTIDLRRLAQAPVEVSGEIAADDPLWAGAGVELATPLRVELTADGSPTRGVWVRGRLAAWVNGACRRCLKPLELEIDESFDWLFDPKTADADGDLTVYGFDPQAEEIDLRDPLRERLLLGVPAYPSCEGGCYGLCSRCGKSLEEGDCDCGVDEEDPRWAPLQALRGDDSGTGVE